MIVTGLEFRSIGPAFMSGRIADIAIDPQDDSIWYIGVGSGGIWKTVNAGVTFEPVFDEQSCYSIGCVTIDPHDSNTVWVGTGENVGGRHIGFGDGIYRSRDGGNSWSNLGLHDSQHISEIIVHPGDSNTVFVAVQGPLWTSGGERGFYKTTDGGQSWSRTLGNDQWTGVTDIALDPRNPHRIYAATWDRHRTVAAYMGGGPGTGLHVSNDGGETWEELTHGLPESNMGKIGLAVSPHQPDVLYAAIELDRRAGGVFRSADAGQTWTKMSDAVSGGTGPHYYQELYACPHKFDRIYLMDVRMQVSEDGGATFRRVSEKNKHSDNHALAFRMDDQDYLLAGSDGGLYESFDLAENWRFMANLPVTQFYKIALDDSEPFFNIYGGTQDNSTEGGPSRTDNAHGIQNSDWRVVLDWDGHQPATEPGNPDIVYAERQEGYLARLDMSTGEIVDIQPQPAEGEDYERFNWDAPILVSPHSPTRLYFASQRVWRSDNRGDEWTTISGDLTRDQNRLELPIMGGSQSWDNPWDVSAMSNYNTITSLAESPLQEGLLYAGTDDGLIQVSEDGGENWRRIEVSSLPGVPERAFVNDIRADLHDADTVYVALDNHKYGDFKPYLLASDDRGKSWRSITSNLPERLLVWRVVQDHVQPGLMFAATEFGIYFTINGGNRWTQLEGGVPTISFRDIHLHRRENDLVAASFGRGIYILDDIAPLRELSDDAMAGDAALFATRDAWWYFPRPHLGFEGGKGDLGASHFVAPNPPFGATFTYHLASDLQSPKEDRSQAETEAREGNHPIEFPGWEILESESRATDPKIWLVVKDESGNVVRRIEGPRTKGMHRVSWDLRYPAPDAVELVQGPPPLWGGPPQGLMCAPGTYTVTLNQQQGAVVTTLADPVEFEVKQLRQGALEGASAEEVAAFWRQYESAVRIHTAMQMSLSGALAKIERMEKVIASSQADVGELDQRMAELRAGFLELDGRLNGDRTKQEPGEKFAPIINDRLFAVARGVDRSTYGPTPTHREMLALANNEIVELHAEINAANESLVGLIADLVESGAPWLEGGQLPALGGQ
ncbi:MAG: glycosyl hydrolase [Planctomycetota bacterium]